MARRDVAVPANEGGRARLELALPDAVDVLRVRPAPATAPMFRCGTTTPLGVPVEPEV